MKKILLLCLVLTLISALLSAGSVDANVAETVKKDKYVYLIVGFDDAAENTDVIFTLSFDLSKNIARVAQIPRDTYFNFGASQNKINQIYATKRILGESKLDSMTAMSKAVSQAFGAEFDGFAGISVGTFKKIVDAIGGVDITLPKEAVIAIDGEDPLILNKGENHIDGSAAEKFIRYRSGYVRGDLGRIDAQKLFLNAMFAKISDGISVSSMLEIALALKSDIVTDIKINEILPSMLKTKKSKEEKKTFYTTVPGEAAFNSAGVSFYVLNRKSAAEVAKDYMFSNKSFDPLGKFCNYSETEFINIYEDESISRREFSNESISDMRISS